MASEFLEILSPTALEQLKEAEILVKNLADNIKTINNFKSSNIPSGADKNIQQLNIAYKEQVNALKLLKIELDNVYNSDKKEEQLQQQKLITQHKSNIEKKSALALLEAERKATNSQNREAERLLATNKKLNDAYGQLTKKRNEAARALQNLIVFEGSSTAEIKKAQKEFDILNKKVGQADKAIGKFSQANNGIQKLTSGISNLMGAFGISLGVGLFVEITKNIYETTKQLQSLDLALKMVSGTTKEFGINQAFVSEIAQKWGIEIKGLTEQYTQFYTASKGILSTEKIKTVFESIAKSGALMGLSVEKQNAAFYAFEQMMSKGVVSAEELKKQLGNAMPGAMKAAGMAYMELHPKIKSIQEAEGALMKEMKNGAIDSATYVPLIVKNFEKLYGIETVNKVETLQAAQERLANSWTNMVRSMNENESSGIGIFFKFLIDRASQALDWINKVSSSWDTLQKRSVEKGQTSAAKVFKSDMKEDVKLGLAGLSEQERKEKLKNIYKGVYEDYRKEYNELAKKTKILAQNSSLKGSDYDFFIKKGIDPKRKVELKEQLALYQELVNIANTTHKTIFKSSASPAGETKTQNKARLKAIKDARHVESVGTPTLSKEENTTLEKLKLLKEALEKTRDETSKNSLEFAQFEKSLKGVNEAIDIITKPLTTNITKDLEASVEGYNKYQKKITELKNKGQEDLKNYINSFSDDMAKNLGFGESFDFFLKMDEDGRTMFDKLNDYADGSKEKQAATFQAIAESAQEAFNFIEDLSQKRFASEYSRLEKEKEIALGFAGDSDAAKKKIEEDYEKRRKEIAKREFKAKQQQAIVNIAIDTAQAIVGLWVKPGFPAAIPMAIAVGALGALSAGMVASQKMPEYWKGTDNAEAGLAWTQEKGAEIVTDKRGNIKDFGSDKGAKLTMMEKGDKVYTAEQTKKMMFNNELNSLMMDNGIGNSSKTIVNNGMTKAEMQEVMMNTLGNMPMQSTIIDKNGLQHIITNGHSKTVFLSNRVSGVGLKV